MTSSYQNNARIQNYLLADHNDCGLRVRISGDLLLIFQTARSNDERSSRRKTRGVITEFSAGAAMRMGRYLRETVVDYKYMHTLTYPSEYPCDGRLVKEQLRRYLQEITRLAVANGRKHLVSHFWFIEFQKRGAPHFHIFTTEFVDYELSASLWFNIVDSGDEKHLKAGVRVEKLYRGRTGCIKYAKKYAKKQEQKQIPANYENVGKFWGVWGLKQRLSADVVFFNDFCSKNENNEIKTQLFDIIQQAIEYNDARMLKSEFGFRCFHIDKQSKWYQLLYSEIERCSVLTKSYEESFMYDAELVSYGHDLFTGALVTGAELYVGVKNGEVSFSKTRSSKSLLPG